VPSTDALSIGPAGLIAAILLAGGTLGLVARRRIVPR
jgi:hypothetical protein